MAEETYDTIVIGGGHNGLTAAAYLARAGQKVLVVEALDRLGGFCTTDAYAPDASGFSFSPHALDHVLMAVEPSVATELNLRGDGLDYMEIDPFGGRVDADGTQIVLWRDLDRTLVGLKAISPSDAAAYRDLMHQGRALWRLAIPYLMAHPSRPDLGTLGRILVQAVKSGPALPALARLAVQPAEAMIDQRFTHPAVRSLFMTLAASGGIPTDAAGSGILATVLALEHDSGVLRPRGGSGKLIEALAGCVQRHGGQIRTGSPIDRLSIDDGAVTGVEIDGRSIAANAVLAAIDPVSLAERLIGFDRLPPATRKEFEGLGQFRANIGMGSVGARLSARPVLKDAPETLLASSLFLGPPADGVVEAIAEARVGRIPNNLPIWLILPSVADRSLVPAGSDEETAYLYLPVLPRRLASSDWGEQRDAVFQAVMATADAHLPGFSDLVVSHFVHTPDDLRGWSHDNRGGPYHVDLSLDQLGPWRPTPSFRGYRTPIKRLFHAGAGAHPLGTLNGWSGRSAARLILSQSRRGGR